MNSAPFVSIRCLVYNHALYLRQCLDGFIMQKTNFVFEVIVHDDASTDDSAAIIQEYAEKYPSIIKPIYETENQYSKHDGSLGKVLNAAICPKAKYIAMCEGDDYWTDPLKLQKQVDFLEQNPSYVFCCHRFKIWLENEKKFKEEYADAYYHSNKNLEITYSLMLKTWITQPLTTLIRSKAYWEVYQELELYHHVRDIHLFYLLMKRGRGISLNDNMGVYRWHSKGISSMVDKKLHSRDFFLIVKELIQYHHKDSYIKGLFSIACIERLHWDDEIALHNRLCCFLSSLWNGQIKYIPNLFFAFLFPRSKRRNESL